ncbi:MAG: hypothetical protein ABI430_03820 [Candidatus Taylorbacteria bacterium]
MNITLNKIFKSGIIGLSIFCVFVFGAPRAEAVYEDSYRPTAFPVVRTGEVSNVTANSAHIEGYGNPQGAPGTVAYFEWGTKNSMHSATSPVAITVPKNFDAVINNLAPHTTYFYRAVLKNSYYTKKGDIRSFTTLSIPRPIPPRPTPHPYPYPPTPTPTPQPVGRCELSLSKSVDRTSAEAEDILIYTIDFNNRGDGDCAQVKIDDTISSSLSYLSESHSSNVGVDSSSSSGTLVWNAGTLSPGESGWISWRARVVSSSCSVFDIRNVAHISSSDPYSRFFTSNTVTTRIDSGNCNDDSSSSLSISCSVDDRRISIDESVTRRVTISGGRSPFEIEWSGTDGLDGTGRTVTWDYSRTGTKNATVTVTDDNGTFRSARCGDVVVDRDSSSSSSLRLGCTVDDDSVRVGDRVTRRVEISGGNSPYEIDWSGTDNLNGSGRTISKTYSSRGTKRAEVRVTDDDGRDDIADCEDVTVSSSGGSSSSSNFNEPDVTLFQSVQPAPLSAANVALTQVPYTGLEEYPRIVLFMFAVLIWCTVIGGIIIVRNVRKNRRNALTEKIQIAIESEARGQSAVISQDAVKTLALASNNTIETALDYLRSVITALRAKKQNSDELISVDENKIYEILGNQPKSSSEQSERKKAKKA